MLMMPTVSPEGGLTVYFRAGDDDPVPEYRDVNLNLDANLNIENLNLNLIDLPDRNLSNKLLSAKSLFSTLILLFAKLN